MFEVVKRDGEIAEFNLGKINDAIAKAFEATGKEYNDDIIGLYKEIKDAIGNKQIHIAYLKAEPDDIRNNLIVARKERVDDKGNEVWFSMLCHFFDNCPHAVRNNLKGEDGLVKHWIHRQELELRICEEIFKDSYSVLPSKGYGKLEI